MGAGAYGGLSALGFIFWARTQGYALGWDIVAPLALSDAVGLKLWFDCIRTQLRLK
jgi:hypothetical protein